ncbi:MAG: cation diffusion facilitator family transporter [Oscillospiraceae bacterium]|nr:cation diffusion facilitator family transporter [Oscillospiraceae bacterium]
MNQPNKQIAMRAARNSIIINIGLSAFKLVAGILAQSTAMISDAAHSIADLFSTVIAIIGVKLASKQPDKDHPYGHERFECVAAIVLAALVLSTGIGIGWAGIQRILTSDFHVEEIAAFGVLALVAALVSIAVKEGVYWYMRAAAKKVDSSALMADAWHSRLDGITSIGSFIGIFGALLGFPILDPIAAIAIAFFILKTAISIFKEAVGKMTDKACDDHIVQEMRQVILAQESVVGIDQLKTRLFGSRIYVDVGICVDATLTVHEAHGIAQHAHDAIETQFPKVKHCMVHVNPADHEN